MILVLPFSLKDHALARKLAKWIVALGDDFKEDSLLLVQDSRVTDNHQILDTLGPLFQKSTQRLYADDGVNAWPFSANRMFNAAAKEIEYGINPEPWLWLEPDSVPMKKGWWAALKKEFVEVAWGTHKKVFMGDEVNVPDVPLHMSGVGFYPALISQHAYEAAMAADVAWDVAAAHQIVPKAYWTKKIIHNWLHPPFKTQAEVDNLRSNHPEMLLFHSDKSGTLIDWLEKEADTAKPGAAIERLEVIEEANALMRAGPSPEAQVGPSPKAQIGPVDLFIKTYPADYPWLEYCLESIAKFATGFRTVVIISDEDYPRSEIAIPPVGDAEVSVRTVSPQPDGYLWQQVIKLDADQYTDAEWIVYMDSDCIFKRPITAQEAIELPWMMTPYSDKMGNEKVWHWVTERFLKQPVEFEFMRRHPFVAPRWLLKGLRDFCYSKHGTGLDQYILNCPTRNFSEFNALGAYAYYYHHDKFIWVNTEAIPPEKWPILYVNQEWSKGGLTDQIKKEYEELLGGGLPENAGTAVGETQVEPSPIILEPKEAFLPPARVEKSEEVVGGSNSDEDEPESDFPGIHQTREGWWVIDGDERIGLWVEQEGRLDHDHWLLERILPLVKKGDTVVEVGAYIGDHTKAFLDAGATVYAYEPNPTAAECLRRNCPDADITEGAAWSESTELGLTIPPDNPGASYLAEAFKNGGVIAEPLDRDIVVGRLNLIMLDAEGSELFALRGAEKLIQDFHPILIIEINRAALGRYGYREADVFLWLKDHGYEYKAIQENLVPDPPQYDVIAKYTVQEKEKPAPKKTIPFNEERVADLVIELATYCGAPMNKARVKRALVGVGIFPATVLKKRR